MVTPRTVQFMKNNNKSSNLPSPVFQEDSRKEPQANPQFRLIAEKQNTESKDTNLAQAIRSLYEGSSKPEDFTLNIEEINNSSNPSFNEHDLLRWSPQSKSVGTACNAPVIHTGDIDELDNTQTSVVDGELSC